MSSNVCSAILYSDHPEKGYLNTGHFSLSQISCVCTLQPQNSRHLTNKDTYFLLSQIREAPLYRVQHACTYCIVFCYVCLKVILKVKRRRRWRGVCLQLCLVCCRHPCSMEGNTVQQHRDNCKPLAEPLGISWRWVVFVCEVCILYSLYQHNSFMHVQCMYTQWNPSTSGHHKMCTLSWTGHSLLSQTSILCWISLKWGHLTNKGYFYLKCVQTRSSSVYS